jgi:hypothetical protein
MTTALVDFVMVHPTAATYVNNYGTSGDAAKIAAGNEVCKYGGRLACRLNFLCFLEICECISPSSSLAYIYAAGGDNSRARPAARPTRPTLSSARCLCSY